MWSFHKKNIKDINTAKSTWTLFEYEQIITSLSLCYRTLNAFVSSKMLYSIRNVTRSNVESNLN